MLGSNGSRVVSVTGARRAWTWRYLGPFTVFAGIAMSLPVPISAATSVSGRVTGAGEPISGCTVTLWAASAGAPKQLAQAQTGDDGSFSLRAGDAGNDASLY